MNVANKQELLKTRSLYLKVFYALLVATVLTVGASYLHFGQSGNVAVALLIATAKAALVAGFFMHLVKEKPMIYGLLAFCFFFVASMMFLILLAESDLVAIRHVP